MSIILTFFYIFGFHLHDGHGIDSTMIVAAFLFFYCLLNPRYLSKVFRFVFSTRIMSVVFLFVLVNLWSVFVVLMKGQRDFSFLKTFFHMFYILILGAMLYCYFDIKKESGKIVNYIIIAFVIQTAIEWLGFLLPPVKQIINFTKSTAVILKGEGYSGVRANALAGSDFFGLSVAFAMMYLIYVSKRNTVFQNNRPLKMALLFFLISGTFFAGRTGYIGLLIAVAYLAARRIIVYRRAARKLRAVEWLCIAGGIGAFIFAVVFAVDRYSADVRFSNLFNFTFQSFFNKAATGSFNVSSMDSLRNMYFEIPFDTFILGDGQYINPLGGYYMSTDVGYLRVILYIGIVGFLLLFFLQLQIIGLGRGKEKLLKWFVLLLLLVLNVKGEVIVWSQLLLAVETLFLFQDLYYDDKPVLYIESVTIG